MNMPLAALCAPKSTDTPSTRGQEMMLLETLQPLEKEGCHCLLPHVPGAFWAISMPLDEWLPSPSWMGTQLMNPGHLSLPWGRDCLAL